MQFVLLNPCIQLLQKSQSLQLSIFITMPVNRFYFNKHTHTTPLCLKDNTQTSQPWILSNSIYTTLYYLVPKWTTVSIKAQAFFSFRWTQRPKPHTQWQRRVHIQKKKKKDTETWNSIIYSKHIPCLLKLLLQAWFFSPLCYLGNEQSFRLRRRLFPPFSSKQCAANEGKYGANKGKLAIMFYWSHRLSGRIGYRTNW